MWQYVNLTNRIFLIDCPGVVPSDPAIIDDQSKVNTVTRVHFLETLWGSRIESSPLGLGEDRKVFGLAGRRCFDEPTRAGVCRCCVGW